LLTQWDRMRVACGVMPDHQGAGTDTDPLMGPVVLALMVLLYIVAGRAAGLTWKTLLHWAGEALLLVGILLAALGISEVRREWTLLPGFWGTMKQKVQVTQTRVASFLWLRWNLAVERWPGLAKRLHMRIHLTPKALADSGVALDKMSVSGIGTVDWGPPPAAGVPEERLAWLEARMKEAGEQLRNLYTWHWQEVQARQDVAGRERNEREADVQGIRDSIATLAGGGLKLQTWGVACLLVAPS